MRKYAMPPNLRGRCDPAMYERWLQRKAAAHVRRDRRRGNAVCTIADYKAAIHNAVKDHGDHDFYTGEALNWRLISQWNNEASTVNGREYKQQFALLPTVDHLDDGKGAPQFAICAWRTNDAKHDLRYDEFLTLCRVVIAWARGHGPATRARAI